MDRTLKCDHSLESCGEILCSGVVFVFQFYTVRNFGKFIKFELGTARSEINCRFERLFLFNDFWVFPFLSFPYSLSNRAHLVGDSP